MNEHMRQATTGGSVKDAENDALWTDVDVTTDEDVDRNTHSAEGARRLRELAEQVTAGWSAA